MDSSFAYIACGIFQTVEFYVIVSVAAAAVIALMALPERKGEVKVHMLQGELVTEADDSTAAEDEHNRSSLVIECHSGNIVTIRREGLYGVSSTGAVSLVVNVSGFDITMEERVTSDNFPASDRVTAAIFRLDFLAPEWYHIRYNSDQYSEHAAFSLHVKDGIKMIKPLIH